MAGTAPKAKLFPFQPRSPLLAAAMQSTPFILAINWCLQGTRGMQAKELSFRLLLEAALATAAAGALAGGGMAAPVAVVLGLALAHSFNFLANGQLWVCARYGRAWHRDPAALDAFLAGTADRLRRLPWLAEALCIGSQGPGQGTRGSRSDIDLRLVFPPGPGGWLRVNLLLLELRARALVAVIPLDLYAYDDLEAFGRFRPDEPLLIVLDRHGRLARRFGDRRLAYQP